MPAMVLCTAWWWCREGRRAGNVMLACGQRHCFELCVIIIIIIITVITVIIVVIIVIIIISGIVLAAARRPRPGRRWSRCRCRPKSGRAASALCCTHAGWKAGAMDIHIYTQPWGTYACAQQGAGVYMCMFPMAVYICVCTHIYTYIHTAMGNIHIYTQPGGCVRCVPLASAQDLPVGGRLESAAMARPWSDGPAHERSPVLLPTSQRFSPLGTILCPAHSNGAGGGAGGGGGGGLGSWFEFGPQVELARRAAILAAGSGATGVHATVMVVNEVGGKLC